MILRKLLVWVLVAGASIVSTAVHARAPVLVSNLIGTTNGQFDAGGAGKPTGYYRDSWGAGLRPVFTYPVTGVNPSTGAATGKAARVEILAPYTEGDAKWAFGLKAVVGGTWHYYSDQFKSTGRTKVTLEYRLSGETGLRYIDLAWYDKSPSTWAKAQLRFRMPTSAVEAQVYHYPVGVGRLDTDNIVFGQIKPRGTVGGLLTLTLDDGNDNFGVGQMLINKGAPATYCLIPGTFNPWDADIGYLTPAQAKQLRLMGHDIGCNHTFSHLHLPQLSPDQAFAEIANGKQSLWDQLGVDTIVAAYPFGEYARGADTQTIPNMFRDTGHEAARTVDPGFNTAATNKYLLKTISIDRTVPLSFVYAQLAEAKRLGQWIIITGHAFNNNTAEQYSNSVAYLMAIVDKAKALGIPIDTFLNALTELK